MKAKSTLILLAGAAFLLTSESCKRADACIQGPDEITIGEPATFTSCGGGKEFTWEVFNGVTQVTTEGESVTFTPQTPTEFGQIRLVIEGGFLGGDDETSATYKVINTGYPLFVRDYQFDQGNTNIEGVSNAEVKVFSSFTCFENDDESSACLLASGMTDSEGIYKIPADLSAGTYVIDVTGLDIHANWSENVRDMEVSISSEQLYWEDQSTWVTIQPNGLRLLQSNEWSLTDVKINGSDAWEIINDCVKDNYLTVDKAGNFEYQEGSEVCSPNTESMGVFTGIPSTVSNYPDNPTISFNASGSTGPFSPYSGSVYADGTLHLFTSDGNNSAEYIFTP